MFKLYTHSWKNNKLFKHFAFPLYIAYILVTCQQIVALPHQFLLGCSTVEPHRGLCASFFGRSPSEITTQSNTLFCINKNTKIKKIQILILAKMEFRNKIRKKKK